MKLTIESVYNGYIIRTDDGEDLVVEERETETGGVDAMASLLWCIMDKLGHPGSKHDAKRIYVVSAPGLDHPDFKSLDHAHFGSD